MYAELKRVQQYFGKIKAAEEPEAQRNLVVNQEAAARILKADLVSASPHAAVKYPPRMIQANYLTQGDNKTISAKLAEKIAEERARALLKSVEGKKRTADDSAASVGSGSDAQASKKRKQRGKGKGSKK